MSFDYILVSTMTVLPSYTYILKCQDYNVNTKYHLKSYPGQTHLDILVNKKLAFCLEQQDLIMKLSRLGATRYLRHVFSYTKTAAHNHVTLPKSNLKHIENRTLGL